jgi:hypothetical protein
MIQKTVEEAKQSETMDDMTLDTPYSRSTVAGAAFPTLTRSNSLPNISEKFASEKDMDTS